MGNTSSFHENTVTSNTDKIMNSCHKAVLANSADDYRHQLKHQQLHGNPQRRYQWQSQSTAIETLMATMQSQDWP
jgi:hypothetical protein